ncbi:MAG: glycosyltransferase family 9 protein [Bacteroidetes bacterium]|nr:glycosyltransferase family 9 protein [Bacteroidota bacterium]
MPLAGIIKNHFPNCKIIFIGRTYTEPIVLLSKFVDRFLNADDYSNVTGLTQEFQKIKAGVILHVFPNEQIAKAAKKAKINLRIGTRNRLFHLFTCNQLVKLSRKNSNFHEAVLNQFLLKPLNIEPLFNIKSISEFYGFSNIPQLSENFKSLILKNKTTVVIHPKSKGSAREWGIENFKNLISKLPSNQYAIYVTGTKEDENFLSDLLQQNNVINLCGKMNLTELIAFIAQADVLIAASTGPLHIAAALGKRAIGIYAPMRPIFPTRWAPIGEKAGYIVLNKQCNACRKSLICNCILNITPEQIISLIENNG